jgi:hypothetical protein
MIDSGNDLSYPGEMGLTAVVPGCCPALIYFLTSYRQVLMKAYRLAGGA